MLFPLTQGLPYILKMNGLISHIIRDVWNRKGPNQQLFAQFLYQ
jgi:hypothetical protein